MQIDEAIEERVRTAFGAVIGEKPAELKAVLVRFTPGELQTAVSYAAYVCAYIVADVLDGELPEDGLEVMAQQVVEDNKSWVDLGEVATVVSFLKASATSDASFPGVPDEDVAGNSFVIAASLLSRFRPEGQRWFEYLDGIWNSAQAADS